MIPTGTAWVMSLSKTGMSTKWWLWLSMTEKLLTVKLNHKTKNVLIYMYHIIKYIVIEVVIENIG